MTAVSIKEAKAKLSELIHRLKPGDEVVIMEKNVPWPACSLPLCHGHSGSSAACGAR
jgi:PHD/YefM family antitoxin component YafN of YafNO toxin-antitoxin module